MTTDAAKELDRIVSEKADQAIRDVADEAAKHLVISGRVAFHYFQDGRIEIVVDDKFVGGLGPLKVRCEEGGKSSRLRVDRLVWGAMDTDKR